MSHIQSPAVAGIQIDLSRDSLMSSTVVDVYRCHYMTPGETSPQEALRRAAIKCSRTTDEAQRLYDLASKGAMAFPGSAFRH